MTATPHDVCFIIPPKVLRHLAEKEKDTNRKKQLLDSALLSEHLRGQRVIRSLIRTTNCAGEKRRTIYDCKHKESQPPRGTLARGEGAPENSDATVNQAYDSCGKTYDFYQQIFKRNSIDNKGMRLDSYVHFGKGYNNAFWDGAEMVYGDGDGQLFLGFASAIDVVAHELTHGVTQFSTPGGLNYDGQSGALNESISDVFGSVVKQWTKGQNVSAADWLIGAGIMSPQVGKALRSMKDPGNKDLTWAGDDQPGTMDGYVQDGDVHTNSGIPNHAFYLAATALGGNSWEKAGPIWYKSLPRLSPDATFDEAAKATVDVAAQLFGQKESQAVLGAWKAVKVA